MDELNKHIKSITGVPLFSELSADHLRDVVSICKLKNFQSTIVYLTREIFI
ncbi:MAG: hypothetical protein GXO85_09320 [Chlorobi bacterium]|nr:hypothetical protein [Chlorobiota bacterium]